MRGFPSADRFMQHGPPLTPRDKVWESGCVGFGRSRQARAHPGRPSARQPAIKPHRWPGAKYIKRLGPRHPPASQRLTRNAVKNEIGLAAKGFARQLRNGRRLAGPADAQAQIAFDPRHKQTDHPDARPRIGKNCCCNGMTGRGSPRPSSSRRNSGARRARRQGVFAGRAGDRIRGGSRRG